MALIDQAKKLKQAEAEEGPQHEAMPGDDAEDMDEGEAPDTEDDGIEEAGNGKPATPELIAQMQQALEAKIPPQFKDAVARVVTAGKKVMYSPGSKEMIQQELGRKAPIDAKLAHAAAGLITMLGKEAKGTMPPEAATLGGAMLVLEMSDFVLKIGQPLTSQDVRDALDQFLTLTMMQAGANEQQIMGALGAKGAPPQQQPAAPQPPMPMQGGMPA
jgi:hypothetical protein